MDPIHNSLKNKTFGMFSKKRGNVKIRLEGEVKAIEVRQEGTEERRKILVDESNKYRQNTDKVGTTARLNEHHSQALFYRQRSL